MATLTKYSFDSEMDIPSLVSQIQASSIVTVLDHIQTNTDLTDVWFKDALSEADVTTLNAVVAAYTYVAPAPRVLAVAVQNIPVVTTQYELNDKDLKLAKASAQVVAETQKALLSIKVPGTFGADGRYITGGYGTTEDYDKDDYALVWVADDDRYVAMAVALAMNPEATEPLSDETIQGMGEIPGFGISMPSYPMVKAYYDEEADEANRGWYFWPVAQGNSLDPVGETEVETIAGFAFIPSGFYLKIQYCRPEAKTTGSIRVNFFWGRKG